MINLEKMKEIAMEMVGQDNRATAEPIYVVQQRRRIYGMDPGCACSDDDVVWLYDGTELCEDTADDDTREELEIARAYYQLHGETPEGWECTGYIDTYETVQSFFSEKAAQRFIEARKHNLKNPRIYVDSAYHNPEWKAIRAFLLELSTDESTNLQA